MRYKTDFFLCVLLSLIFPLNAGAQTMVDQTNSGQYNIRKWNSNNGLISNIYSMAQTPDGFLWMGYESGIIRFDGTNIYWFHSQNTKEMTENFCRVLYLARDSTLYCGMDNGQVYRLKNNHFKSLGARDSFYGKSINAICEDGDGSIWIAPEGMGLVKYSKEGFFKLNRDNGLPSNEVNAITRGLNNEIWIGTDAGICCIKDKNVVSAFNLQNGLLSNDITALCMSGDTLWAGSTDGQLMLLVNGKVSEIMNGHPGNVRLVSSIIVRPDKKICIGTKGDGLFLYDPAKKRFENVTTGDGLSSNMITAVITNAEGDLMAGTQGNGLNRIRKNAVRSYSKRDGMAENYCMSVCRLKNGSILVGHREGGISQYMNGKFSDISSKAGIDGLPVFSIAEDSENKIHVATEGAIISWDGKQKNIFKAHSGLDNSLFHAVYFDRKGTMWAGTNAGVYLFKGQEMKTMSVENGLSDNRVLCFLEDHLGKMWVGTMGGITIIDNNKTSVLTKKNGLADNIIMSMYEDSDGTIWIGTFSRGLNRIDGKTGMISLLDSLNLQQKPICQIMEDKAHHLWLGTEDGIYAINKKDLDGYVKGLNKMPGLTYLGVEEGVPGDCVGAVFPAGCVTPDEKLWFPTNEGIAEIDPSTCSMQVSSPVVLIDSIKVNNKTLAGNGAFDLPAGVIHMEICYTAPSYIAPEKLTYRYKLEGYDHEWTEAGDRKFAIYTKVPEGHYTFRVEVRNNQGMISAQQASAQIYIQPFFYQTWWFRTLCLVFILMAGYGFFVLRIRQIKTKELEILVLKRTDEIRRLNESLEQKVSDRTTQLAATNTELEAFSYSVSHDLKAPVRRIEGLIQALIEDYGAQLDENATDFLVKIRESIVSMNILIEELLKLSRIARQELDITEVNLSGMAAGINENLKRAHPDRVVNVIIQPDMVVEADARLTQIALQNLFDNAWKYTGKEPEAKIEFGLTEKDGKQLIFIRDNGVGFDMGHYEKLFTPFQRLHSDDQFIGTGIGLATVKRIILKHGGWISAESEPGKGAAFCFTLS